MTKEGEEVEILKAYRDKLFNSASNQLDKDIKAFDAAIKALEQESKILNTLDFAIDASNGNTNYFVGFRNGLRYSKSLIDGKEPQFESCTEPKTGRWIWELEDWNKWTCSECGYFKRTDIHSTLGYNYCPNCGAKMEDGNEK